MMNDKRDRIEHEREERIFRRAMRGTAARAHLMCMSVLLNPLTASVMQRANTHTHTHISRAKDTINHHSNKWTSPSLCIRYSSILTIRCAHTMFDGYIQSRRSTLFFQLIGK